MSTVKSLCVCLPVLLRHQKFNWMVSLCYEPRLFVCITRNSLTLAQPLRVLLYKHHLLANISDLHLQRQRPPRDILFLTSSLFFIVSSLPNLTLTTVLHLTFVFLTIRSKRGEERTRYTQVLIAMKKTCPLLINVLYYHVFRVITFLKCY